MQSPSAVILMYHRVADEVLDPWGICVTPANFSSQLDAIASIATPLSLTDLATGLRSGDLPERSVVVTFDDGYLDNLTAALPALQQHGIPATVFVTTCNVDSDREFWWDRLETLLLEPRQLPESLSLQFAEASQTWNLGSAISFSDEDRAAERDTRAWAAREGSRLRFFFDVWKVLRPLSEPQRNDALTQITQWTGKVDSLPGQREARRTMSSTEIGLLGRNPLMTIGAHTVDHALLPSHDATFQTRQIADSKERLEQITGSAVRTFAYPHGEHSPTTVSLLQQAGFDCAVTIKQKAAGLDSDPMLLPRFGVRDHDGEALAGQLRGWFALPGS